METIISTNILFDLEVMNLKPDHINYINYINVMN